MWGFHYEQGPNRLPTLRPMSLHFVLLKCEVLGGIVDGECGVGLASGFESKEEKFPIGDHKFVLLYIKNHNFH